MIPLGGIPPRWIEVISLPKAVVQDHRVPKRENVRVKTLRRGGFSEGKSTNPPTSCGFDRMKLAFEAGIFLCFFKNAQQCCFEMF